MDIESHIKDLSPELQEKARACGSVGELMALAKEAKVPLPDEALAAIAGGDQPNPANCGEEKCPQCGSKDTTCYRVEHVPLFYNYYWRCNKCGYEWKESVIEG